MRPRLMAAGVLVAWILFSMALLLLFRGLPIRLRGTMILASLLLLILGLGYLKFRRRR